MPPHNQIHDSQIRNDVGDESIHAKAAEPSEGLVTYSIVAYSAHELPKAYRHLIFTKWLRSLRYGNDFFKLIDSGCYYAAYDRYIAMTLERLNAVVRLAVLTDTPDVALGFSVCRDNILEYVHVQKEQRLQGIGTALVPAHIDTITHLTKIGLSIWGSKYKQWKFNPFA